MYRYNIIEKFIYYILRKYSQINAKIIRPPRSIMYMNL